VGRPVTPGRVKSVPPADRCSILLIIRSIGTRLKNYLSARRRAKSGQVIADINHEEEFMGRLVILKSFHVWDRGRTKQKALQEIDNYEEQITISWENVYFQFDSARL
jgi:hypothetical protein